MKLGLLTTYILTVALAAASYGQTPDFIPAAAYPTSGDAAFTTAADFNRDGRPDIVTYESATQSLSILFATADGVFQPPVSRPLGLPMRSFTAADLNGDGAADLAIATGNQLAILLNNGDGSFAPPTLYVAGIAANYVTTADLNRDGALDLVVGGTSGLAVFRGLGTGAFNAPLVLPTTLSHFWIGVADFNGDGKLDLVADGSPGAFYAGNGDGTFAAPVSTIVAIGYGAAVGDFSGDGKPDIAFLENTFNQERASGQQVTVLLGTGTGSFLNWISMFFTGPGSGQVAAGDFNGDGRTDLAIWLDSPSWLYLMTDGSSLVKGVHVDLTAAYGAKMTAADVDGNGSTDVLLLNPSVVRVVRNTHGNPPLLALASLDRASVTGGQQAQVTLTLGGPAPAGGASVALSSGNPAIAYPTVPNVIVPAGASTATVSVMTTAVAVASPVTISGAYNGVVQPVTLTVVAPYSLSGVTVSPASQFGGSTVQGTITLTGPADSNATVYLSSSNGSAASVPASVLVQAGATSTTFSIACQPVTADTPVVVSASMGGVNASAGVTVLRPLDQVQMTRAQYTLRSGELRIEATSTNANATLSVWNAATGTMIGNLSPAGGGKYTATFTVKPAVQTATVKSSLGGFATGAVQQK